MDFKEGHYQVQVNCQSGPVRFEGSFQEVANQFFLMKVQLQNTGYTVYGGRVEPLPNSDLTTLVQPQIDMETREKMKKEAEINPLIEAQVSLAHMLGMFN